MLAALSPTTQWMPKRISLILPGLDGVQRYLIVVINVKPDRHFAFLANGLLHRGKNLREHFGPATRRQQQAEVVLVGDGRGFCFREISMRA